MITMEDDPFFEIELKFSMYNNSEFVDFNENDWE